MNKNQQAVAVFNKHAKLYETKYMDISMYAEALDTFCQTMNNPTPLILDIGCGPGNLSTYIVQKLPDCSLTGIDLAAEMIELAKANIPQAQFKVMDCRSIATFKQKFDAIVCGFCLPYLNEIEATKLIRDCRNLLNPRGSIYLSTMEGSPEESTLLTSSTGDQVFTHYYKAEFLREQLEKSGFQIVLLKRIESSNPPSKPVTDLVMIGRLNS